VEKSARKLRRQNPRLSYEQAMFDALIEGRGGRPVEKLTPHVVIGLPEWAKLLRHEGDECVFALTDGTTITGAELVTRLMNDFHLVGLYDPCSGPVNLYRSRRQSNTKQSALLAAESILCEWPGCTTAAEQSQDHHIRAWHPDGATDLRNLAKLCRKHNGDNDDDPDAPPRNGRVEREGSEVIHRGPDGKIRRNTHPIRNLSARALAARR
ncbi:MAG TPA: HNH endonuclease signature motif containing protein, partial [Corynebacterium sp.]|nr:HNH endonuclease signature motif containing protein [Corynebacterium sp.]